MAKTIELCITTPEGAATQAMQMAPDSDGSFAQLLTLLLTEPVGSLDMPLREPAPHETDCKSTRPNEPVTIDPAVLPITLPPVLPVWESREITPAFLEGGRLGAGDTALCTPAPPLLFLSNQQEICKLDYIFRNKYDINKDIANIIQEKSQNIDLGDADGLAVPLDSEHEDIKEIGYNLYFISKNRGMPENWDAVDGAESISEPVAFPSERAEAPHHPKSAPDISPNRSLPFPAFHFTPIEATNAPPAGSATVSSPQPYEQIAQLVEHLALRHQESAVHLRLDPPELGTVEIRIHVEGNAVHAWLAAERDLTRQSLEQQAQQLREQLAARGLHLAHFEVNAGTREAFAQARYAPFPALPYSESRPRPQAAMESASLFGQWSVWA